MNHTILHKEVQDFISEHLNTDISKLILKGSPFKNLSIQDLVEQIEAKKKCEKKLPTWFSTEQIYYPNKLNIEQTSSEITANYKASLVSGQSLIDTTGGFGVDTYHFAKQVKSVTHCEINETLSQIATHNFQQLGAKNIKCTANNGIEYLKEYDQLYHWLYVDPSRRDDLKQKVFLISDCTPNLKKCNRLFLKYAKNVMVKTSPLLDISLTIKDLEFTKEIHVIAVNNEVKELLFILERDYTLNPEIKTINLQKNKEQRFNFHFENEAEAISSFSLPLHFLYEPNSAILKAGGFKIISQKLGVLKIHQHSHLYTSKTLKEFPGRRFKIENVIPFNKNQFSKLKIAKANITTRNFPISVHDIRKKFNVKDGGSVYLFFTTNCNDEKIIIVTSRV
ncbi:THUMP-like domain-containing protein [Winogradskyella sp. A3E31]|uniref:THUMP-like domain-containing protein n=1 Tax=Winogradskyella sp. A3E31 TaxID=3349637 RepID=UPI00398A72FF